MFDHFKAFNVYYFHGIDIALKSNVMSFALTKFYEWMVKHQTLKYKHNTVAGFHIYLHVTKVIN